jgi:hypothetical protein
MKRGIAFLALWLVGAVVLGGSCVSAIPPGGVVWPYYIFMASIPFGAFRYARYDRRASVAICYGLVAGVLFAWPIFGNNRAVVLGVTPPESVALPVGLCTLLMVMLCAGAFSIGCRRFPHDESTQKC